MILKTFLLLFRLNCMIYLSLALGAGYFASQEYQSYSANIVNAKFHMAEGPPDPVPLSKWNASFDIFANGEVNLEGVYLPSLEQGRFDLFGVKWGFILLADEKVGGVSAVLVVRSNYIGLIERQLVVQGSGERIPVTVNGTLNQSSEFADLIWRELSVMDITISDNLVVIEPFIGNRAELIYSAAEESINSVIIFGFLACFLVLLALVKFRIKRKSSAKPSQVFFREALAAGQEDPRSQRSAPSNGLSVTSPWEISEQQAGPLPSIVNNRFKSQNILTPACLHITELEAQPSFVSVFPGGGSSFRFKSADEIILQSFGTLSTLKPLKPYD
jgi:hypothetical protein